jgi:hypothetical protein
VAPATCNTTTGLCSGGACGSVTAKGCCAGEILKYCSGSQVKSEDCSISPKCGWNAAKKWYDCGTAGGADPSGTFPKACP